MHEGKNKSGDVYHDKLMVCDGSRKWKLASCGRTDWFIQQVMELSKFKDRILEDQ